MLTHEEIVHALQHLCPTASWSVREQEDGTNIVEWLDESVKGPTMEAILNACHKCSPEKEAFKTMSRDEKIAYLAKHIGLED